MTHVEKLPFAYAGEIKIDDDVPLPPKHKHHVELPAKTIQLSLNEPVPDCFSTTPSEKRLTKHHFNFRISIHRYDRHGRIL